MVSFLRTAADAVAARWHALAGRLCFHLNLTDHARRHFEQVLRLRGDDFTAYVHLGRMAYGLGDYSGWRREYEHARRTDPSRFARLRHPFELIEPRSAGTLSEETGERATWRTVRASIPQGSKSAGHRGRSRDGSDESSGHHSERPTRHSDAASGERGASDRHGCDSRRTFGDDFESSEERRRFRGMPPIDPQDLAAVDLDAVARRLIAGD
jgi:hypothetical protein